MFVGHYAAALAARAAEPRPPLWAYVLSCQAIDIVSSGLVMAGIERAGLDRTRPDGLAVLSYMPYSHSLPTALVWSAAAALGLMLWLKLPRRAALFIGLAALSHWFLDFLLHEPDLPLLWNGPYVGLSLRDYPAPRQALEMGLLAIAASAWGWRRGLEGRDWKGACAFLGFLLFLQIVPMISPLGESPLALGGSALAAYLSITIFAWMTEPYAKV